MIARMQKAMKEKDGGFTLVELIVVVIIIGVLAAIAVPVFLNQSNKAKEKADLADLSSAKIAVASYLADFDGATAPTQANTKSYGMPQEETVSGATKRTITVTWVSTAPGNYTVAMSNGASAKSCSATQDTSPHC